MKLSIKKTAWIMTLFMLMVLPFTSPGKVYLTRLLSRGLPMLDTTAGWQQIYQCPMTINGTAVTLSVYGCDEPVQSVTAKLKQAFPHPPGNNAADNPAWITSMTDDRVLRLMPVAMPDTDQTVIFVLVQTQAEFLKAGILPAESTIFGKELLLNGKMEMVIKNEDTGTTMETMTFPGKPENMAGHIADKLIAMGWKQIYPISETLAHGTCFFIFRRSSAMCTVMAGSALNNRQSCVTFIRKEIKHPLSAE